MVGSDRWKSLLAVHKMRALRSIHTPTYLQNFFFYLYIFTGQDMMHMIQVMLLTWHASQSRFGQVQCGQNQ